jgi:hypothetical protein
VLAATVRLAGALDLAEECVSDSCPAGPGHPWKDRVMAYDEGLATRIREVLADQPGLAEKQMFGGLAFLVHGNMACGVRGDDLIVRVAADTAEAALAEPGTRPFDLTGGR